MEPILAKCPFYLPDGRDCLQDSIEHEASLPSNSAKRRRSLGGRERIILKNLIPNFKIIYN